MYKCNIHQFIVIFLFLFSSPQVFASACNFWFNPDNLNDLHYIPVDGELKLGINIRGHEGDDYLSYSVDESDQRNDHGSVTIPHDASNNGVLAFVPDRGYRGYTSFNFIVKTSYPEHCEIARTINVSVGCADTKISLSASPSTLSITLPNNDSGTPEDDDDNPRVKEFTVTAEGGGGTYTFSIVTHPHADIGTLEEIASTSNSRTYRFTHTGATTSTQTGMTINVRDEHGAACGKNISIRAHISVEADEVDEPEETSGGNVCAGLAIHRDGYQWSVPINVGGTVDLGVKASGGSGNYEFWIKDANDPRNPVSPAKGVVVADVDGDGKQIFTYTHAQLESTVTDYIGFNVRDRNNPDCTARMNVAIRPVGSAGNEMCKTLSVSYPNSSSSSTYRLPVSVGGSGSAAATLTLRDEDNNVISNYNFYDFDFKITRQPQHGIASITGLNPRRAIYTYTSQSTRSSSDHFSFSATHREDPLCRISRTVYVKINDPCRNSNNSSAEGRVIFDNTANSMNSVINTNLSFQTGCTRSQTTVGSGDGKGVNGINVEDYQIIMPAEDSSKIDVYTGAQNWTGDNLVQDNNYSSQTSRLTYFKSGEHLFDIDRLRWTADWLGNPRNVSPRADVAEGTYGTITLKQFLHNVATKTPMYGVVRVLVPLEKPVCQGGADDVPDNVSTRIECLGSQTSTNALGRQTSELLYRFCDDSQTSFLCSCSPRRSDSLVDISELPEDIQNMRFQSIRESNNICGIEMPEDARIIVNGTLFWDFVDFAHDPESRNPIHGFARPIPLSQLPYHARELYFKVDVPILVNSAFKDDGLEEIPHDIYSSEFVNLVDEIASYTANVNGPIGGEASSVALEIPLASIPDSSKELYKTLMDSELDAESWDALTAAEKYHLLMPSGYARGWAAAFEKLGITAGKWKTLPMGNNAHGDPFEKFSVPASAPTNEPLSVEYIHSADFEDMPVYLYSGGLIDMHDHVYISGLVYVPQAMELEAVQPANFTPSGISYSTDPKFIRQVIVGAVVVRDGFYIHAGRNRYNDAEGVGQSGRESITILSADPMSYSTIRTNGGRTVTYAKPDFTQSGAGTGFGDQTSESNDEDKEEENVVCGLSCVISKGGRSDEDDEDAPEINRQWTEIFPEPPE